MAFNNCTELIRSMAMSFILMRKDLGLDKTQVAARSELSVYLITRLENPTNNNISMKDIENYAAVLGKKVVLSFENRD